MNSNTSLTPWKRFLGLLNIERKYIVQIFYFSTFSGLVALSIPLGVQTIVNLIQGAEISTSWIVLVVLVTLGVILGGILQFMQLRIIETIQQQIFVRSSFELIYRFPKFKMEEISNEYTPELANRFFDTLTIQKGISKVLIDIPTALLQIVFSLILLSLYNSLFIIFGIILLGTLYLVFLFTARRGLQTSLEESKYKYKVANWIQQVARSMNSFKLSGKTNLALEKNDMLVYQYLQARESHFSIIKLQFIKLVSFKAIITAGLLLIGGLLVLNQQMNIGQFVASEIIIILVINSVEKLILGLEIIYDMITAIEKIGQVVDISLEAREGVKVDLSRGIRMEVDNISYTAPSRKKPILQNISLEISSKSRIFVHGENGSGKSTLLQILAGIKQPTEGNIFVNDFPMHTLHLNQYRAQIAMALSEENPFAGTLRENLTFGDKTINDEDIFQVFKHLKLTAFLKELPLGLDTILFPDGKQMSTTISRKIVLARAILKQPKLLILEEAQSTFNQEEAQSIIDFLCEPSRAWALIVVSSNESWKNYCNELIYLKNGRIEK